MKKTLCLILTIIIFTSILLAMLLSCTDSVFALSAMRAILIDTASGKVLMEKDAYTKAPMASTTKIMTALIALELGNPDDIVIVSDNAAETEGSSMWLSSGEHIALRDLTYGLMLNSGNDAATAIAEHIAGDVSGFAVLMNKRATEIGAKDTNFTNPHGLDDENHYTTAYDLALITRTALQNTEFAQIVATKSKSVSWEGKEWGRTLQNHNKMLTMYDGADGVKTGFTKRTGRCLVSSATRGSMQLIAVTLNAPDDWTDHTSMLNFGFTNYSNKSVITAETVIKTIYCENSDSSYIPVVPQEGYSMILKNDNTSDQVTMQHDLPDTISAPILKGQEIGTLYVYVNNIEEVVIPLISVVDADKTAPAKISFCDKFWYLIECITTF